MLKDVSHILKSTCLPACTKIHQNTQMSPSVNTEKLLLQFLQRTIPSDLRTIQIWAKEEKWNSGVYVNNATENLKVGVQRQCKTEPKF